MAKEFALVQFFWDTSAINPDQGFVLPAAALMELTRNQLFSSSGLTQNENRRIRGRHHLDLPDNLSPAGALPNNFVVVCQVPRVRPVRPRHPALRLVHHRSAS